MKHLHMCQGDSVDTIWEEAEGANEDDLVRSLRG